MNYELGTNYSSIYQNILEAGKRYLEWNPRVKTIILGLSGGIDSALIAVLARRICDQLPRDRGVKLIGRSLPIETNTPEEIQRAEQVGKAFCHDFATHYLFKGVQEVAQSINPTLHAKWAHHNLTFAEKVRFGNIKARIRMMYLYDLASEHQGLVLSTDNLTELLLGFWTLHGDVGDLGLIQGLWKTEVYGLSLWIEENVFESDSLLEREALLSCIEAKPTDGLGISNSDIDQLLPAMASGKVSWITAYKAVDRILIKYLTKTTVEEFSEAEQHVINRFEATRFKRTNPFNVPRTELVRE